MELIFSLPRSPALTAVVWGQTGEAARGSFIVFYTMQKYLLAYMEELWHFVMWNCILSTQSSTASVFPRFFLELPIMVSWPCLGSGVLAHIFLPLKRTGD
jgi:hypothetical protein